MGQLERQPLFQLGDFTLNSGAKSAWKLECDSLTDSDIECLAQMIRQMVGSYREVEGIPRGGLRLAEALKPHRSLSGPYLLVDDVLTTGGSLSRRREEWIKQNLGESNVKEDEKPIGAVVFARGQIPHWVGALFHMPQCFWIRPKHR